MAKRTDDRLFIEDFIPRVSRTFALAIRFLPRPLRNSVHAAYLLCRVADTLEDSPHLDANEKCKRLIHLKDLLDRAVKGGTMSGEDLLPLYDSIDTNHGHDHRLLLESTKLFVILENLPRDHKSIIYSRAAEMAGGMAEYVQLAGQSENTIFCLRDIDDWDRYCYYVAGTVGHMLTELFISHFGFDQSQAEKLNRLGRSFGLGLQKVNVIKDVPADRERGVCFLPLDVMNKHGLMPSSFGSPGNESEIAEFVSELLKLTVGHLDDAIEYTVVMPRRHRGVRMFLAVPIFLAVETLNLIRLDPIRALAGPPVKLTRRDVGRLVNAAALGVISNRLLKRFYDKLREVIE